MTKILGLQQISTLILVFIVFGHSTANSQTLIINEVSNGPTGNQEFVEFVVADVGLTYDCGANTPPCIDIRGWIFDDNSGYHGSGGIADGALRFSNNALWSCVPLGTIILLYNDADPNVNLPPMDISMADGNCSIVAPISNTNLFEQNLTTPGAAACSYPQTGWTPGGDWELTFLANSGDCARLVDLSGCEVFSLCWASCSNNSLIYFNSLGSGSQNVWYFNDGDPNIQANWSEGSTTGTSQETPGAPNNAANAAYIGQFNNNCTPILPINVTATSTPSDCGCTGTGNATGSGSLPGYTYQWTDASYVPIGQNTAAATGLCAGVYRVIVTSSIGCSDTASVTVVSNGGGIINVMENISACNNTTITYPDGTTAFITGPTSHVSQLTSTTGCDSIITTTVLVVPFLTSSEIEAVCANTTLTYPDGTSELITGNTTHTSNLTASTGCDSVVTTIVALIPNFTTTETVSVCTGNTITYPDGTTEVIAAATSHISNLTGIFVCDSIVTTNVTISQAYNGQEVASVCLNSNYTFPNGDMQTITGATTHVSTFTNSGGCDSVITTTVGITAGPFVQETTQICQGDDYTFPDGSTQTAIRVQVVHQSVFPMPSGCDSIVETTVTIASSQIDDFSFTPNALGPFEFEAEFQIEAPGNNVYEWSIFDSDTLLIFSSNDTAFSYEFENLKATYQICLSSTSVAGCSVSECKTLKVDATLGVYIPNAFTPEIEGQIDRLNDVFYPIIGGAIVENYQLTIFDRWGKQLFQSTELTLGWDGTYNGKNIPSDVYVYTLSFTTKGLTFLHRYKGIVTMVR
ncbi:MAG: T9SS type B sorting domain-containing protein [Flavobacteriales bacterium]|nr:T9SS type B sorting domain-containing protein [Flavobacteriales bacterium]